MARDKKKVAVGVGLVGLLGLGAYLLTRRAAATLPGKANFYGVVTDAGTGEGVEGILVTLNGYSAITNAAGYYQFTNLEPGGHRVQFSFNGVVLMVGNITLAVGDNVSNLAFSPPIQCKGGLSNAKR